VAGAREAQELLQKDATTRLKVYAVWFNMFPGDDRSRWPEGLLADRRVVEYWDEKRVLGTWFANHPDYDDYPGPVLWDAYLLFGAGSHWEGKPSDRVGWGFTILQTREQLEKDLLGLKAVPSPQ
jgi:hypothetical protein